MTIVVYKAVLSGPPKRYSATNSAAFNELSAEHSLGSNPSQIVVGHHHSGGVQLAVLLELPLNLWPLGSAKQSDVMVVQHG